MDEYFIGAGAVLTAGPPGSITGATLHAQTEAGLVGRVQAALIDFEATQANELTRVLIVAAGWSGPRFQAEVVGRLLVQGECGLADVLSTLAAATGAGEVHIFAHWRLDEATRLRLADQGVRVLAHPLAAIGRAALVSGQRLQRWGSPVRAA
jgi:hypothetical protein